MRNFLVGLASIVALLGLSGLLMFFGELDFFVHKRYQLVLNTDNGSGLRAGAAVEFHGVPIGLVDSVTSQSNPAYPVRIAILIDDGTKLPSDVQPFVSVPLIGATAVLQLRSKNELAAAPLADDGKAEISGPIRGGMFSELTEQLDKRMQPLMDSLERFNKLSDTFVKMGENMNDMMKAQTPAELTSGEQPNLRTAIARLNTVLDEAEHGLALANSFLDDDQLRTDARGAVHKASLLIDQATTAIDRYVKLADSLQTNTSDLTKRLLPVLDTVAGTLEEVRRLAKQANDGKGTAGLLLNNPDLYNSLDDAATRLNRTLTELQALIEQLKAEGVIIKF